MYRLFLVAILSLIATGEARVLAQGAMTGSALFIENRLSVVSIEVAADPSSPNPAPIRGTGFIISDDGWVLTARHVVSGYISAQVTPITVRIGSLNGQSAPADLHPDRKSVV